jgi:hypothetical protein
MTLLATKNKTTFLVYDIFGDYDNGNLVEQRNPVSE